VTTIDLIRLSEISGFWRAFLSLSDFLLLDAPLIGSDDIVNNFIDNRDVKQKYISQEKTGDFSIPLIPNVPNGYHEDDVDTVLHYVFSYILNNTFEGMCNPPGGDWSGLSIKLNNYEYRWLSLPRVSNEKNKRPDHVAELFVPNSKPILFVVESKERGIDLETGIGNRLIGYINWLMGFIPSIFRKCGDEWSDAENKVDPENFEIISVGAYIDDSRYNNELILETSKCDLLFLFTPNVENSYWKIKILSSNNLPETDKIKRILLEQLAGEKDGVYITIAENS